MLAVLFELVRIYDLLLLPLSLWHGDKKLCRPCDSKKQRNPSQFHKHKKSEFESGGEGGGGACLL